MKYRLIIEVEFEAEHPDDAKGIQASVVESFTFEGVEIVNEFMEPA